jgi:16S rRNA C967 or C1407 C5-methylase (RsmB/RsmF family)
MKWRYKENTVENLVAEQRKIFEESLKYLAPNGKIVYATCSVLKEENEDQIEYFLKTYNLKLEETFKSVPSPGKMDGFYAATLSKKSS